jgi:hypothetical protein
MQNDLDLADLLQRLTLQQEELLERINDIKRTIATQNNTPTVV